MVDKDSKQWLDLGDLSAGCISNPDTCTSGGSVSYWINVVDCDSSGGFLSSNANGFVVSFHMQCGSSGPVNYA